MFMFAREVNTQLSAGLSVPVMEKTMEQLKEWGQILGLLQRKSEASVLDDAVEDLIKQRDAARKGKNWAEADRIRAQLSEMGITIEDTPKGARIIARKN
jgi:cysteinyl-tRNA synthetase